MLYRQAGAIIDPKRGIFRSLFTVFSSQRFAFTLSEVLLTLGIIGVIGAMTIPNLIQKQQERQTVVALKAAQSAIGNAFMSAIQDYGNVDQSDYIDGDLGYNATVVTDILAKYMNVTKNCGTGCGCFTEDVYKNLDKTNYIKYDNSDSFSHLLLANGTSLLIFRNSIIDMTVMVDINGFKKPNTLGRDTFFFNFKSNPTLQSTYNRLVPFGLKSNLSEYGSFNDCKNKVSGRGCTAWVLYNENMDYLRCGEKLSWDGPLECD